MRCITMYISRFYYVLLSVHIWHVKLIIYLYQYVHVFTQLCNPTAVTVSQLRLRLRGTIERQLGDYIWEATGKQVEGMWEIIEGRIWQTIGRCEPQGQVEDNWERIGTPHLEQTGGQFGDNWKTTSARQTRDNCVRSGRKNLKDNTSSLLEDNSKTTSGKQLGNNWCTWISA